MRIRPAEPHDFDEWLRMRVALWPDCPAETHRLEMDAFFDPPFPEVVFVAAHTDQRLGGFIEASLRRYGEGCETSPVGYIEGWYVDPELRGQGIGAQLVRTAEGWAAAQGCREMASDCELDNTLSAQAHAALGYRETGRVITFCKPLSQEADGE